MCLLCAHNFLEFCCDRQVIKTFSLYAAALPFSNYLPDIISCITLEVRDYDIHKFDDEMTGARMHLQRNIKISSLFNGLS